MKTLTHEQVQKLLHSGQSTSGLYATELAKHLASCTECQSYAALVAELSSALPSIYSPKLPSPQEIRQKVNAGQSQLLRRTKNMLTFRNLRSGVPVGGMVIVLLVLAILAPKLLPVQQVGAPDLTSTIAGSPTATALPSKTPTAVATLEDVPGTERLVSPDGQYTAIFHPQNISLEIVDAQGKSMVNYLPDPAAAGWVILGTWSPDSQRLTFWQGSNSASLQADGLPLWVLDVQTGAAKELSKAAVINKTYQSWSPDGRFLAFTDGGGRSAQVNKWLSLYMVQDDKLEIVIPVDQLVTGALAWSPWNSQIAVAAVDASQTGPDFADHMGWDNQAIAARRIYLVEPLARAYWRLTETEAYEDAPKWRLDNAQIAFVQRYQDTARIMSANPILKEALPTGCEAPMPPSAQYYGQVDWSELYQTCADATGLSLLGVYPPKLTATPPANTTPPPTSLPNGVTHNSFSVGFSSDGSLLVFNSDVNGLVPEDQLGQMDPFIYNLENSTLLQVIPRIGGNNTVAPPSRAASLSANGRYLIFGDRSSGTGYNFVYLRDLQRGSDEKIDFVPIEKELATSVIDAIISPDGRYLALETVTDNWQVYLLERASGKITPISVDPNGRLGNGDSQEIVFSADGRYLGFVSSASSLVSGDTRCSETNLKCGDVFLYEIATGKLERIPAQIEFNVGSPYPHLTMSADARYLAWTEVITPSPVYRPFISLYDRSTGKTETVWDGMGAYQTGHSPSISNDGRWLAFGALTEYDYGEKPLPDSYPQVYLLDRQTDEAIVISKDANNNWGNGPSGVVSLQQEGWSSDIHISGDGRYVAFSSQAANLLPPGVTKRQCFDPYVVGAYACYDLFVYDRVKDELTWLSQGQP
ncbi:hypothetical protein EG834_01180 [bacterium]|nr:hypothetical protein [bacterium]